VCAGNEANFEMLDNIIGEVASLFPGEYIHIGGDEVNKEFWEGCPKCQKVMADNGLKDEHELQSYFIKRAEKIVESKGKRLIGWDEILEGGLAPNATVMSWRGMEGGIKAASEGHEVVMTPTDFCYLDYMQGDPMLSGFPAPWSKLRLSTVYSFEPVPDGIDPKYILGGQGNVWTEMIEEERQVEYMTWPRAMALAEVLWSPKVKRNSDDFMHRLEQNLPLLDKNETKYARSIYDPFANLTEMPSGELKIEFGSEFPGLDIHYSFNFAFPDEYSPKYNGQSVTIPTGAIEIKAITYRDGKPVGQMLRVKIDDLKNR
jgi:hexosaminidase